jgi:hypothetical protein
MASASASPQSLNDLPRKHTFALKDNWPGPTVGVGADVRFILRIVVTLLLIWRVALTIYLAVIGRYHLSMYTYWSQTMLVAFYVLLELSLFIERGLLTFTTLFAFPILLGSTFIVAVSIIIIIQQNSTIFFVADSSAWTQDALSLLHTGDWILHSLPLVEILFILALGWAMYARAIIASELASIRKSEWKAIYVLYWILAPLVPLLIYSCIFDIATVYPTGIPTYVLWLCLVGIDILWMALMFGAFTATANVAVCVYSFFATPSHDNDDAVETASAQSEHSNGSSTLHKRTPTRFAPTDMVVRVGASDDSYHQPSALPTATTPSSTLYYRPNITAVNAAGCRTLVL